MRREVFLAVGVTLLLGSGLAKADNWVPIPGFPEAYLDRQDIHKESFVIPGQSVTLEPSGQLSPVATTSYLVAWIGVAGKDGNFASMDEMIFDCNGEMAALKQVITNETSQSAYHSFDNTQSYRNGGVPFTDIPPDTMDEAAEAMVCK